MLNRTVLQFLLALLVCPIFAQAPAAQPTTKSGQVGPGVAWENFVLPDGPRNYNIMRVNVADPRITLETESGRDALFRGEKVLDSVKREAAQEGVEIVGGINADFWNANNRSYTPVGFLVADGMIYRMPNKKRSAFLFTKDERSYIGPVSMKVTIGSGNSSLDIETINPDNTKTKEVALFTPPYGEAVPPMSGKRYMLVMSGNEFLPNQPVAVNVTQVSSETSTTLAPNTLVLQIPESKSRNARTVIKDRHVARLVAEIPQIEGVVASACGGGPVLVRDGKPDINAEKEGISQSFVTTRHPRTAIGVTKDQKNVFLVTIDGRQPKISIGANLNELAEFMAKLGCWTAMNLDGGGSTTMVVGDKLVNKPSDVQGPRTVANSILVVVTDPTTSSQAQAGQ